jgi:hypothetical protein
MQLIRAWHLTGLRGFAASHCRANEDRFDPVSRDEADSSVNELPITGLGIKVPGDVQSCGGSNPRSRAKAGPPTVGTERSEPRRR